MRSKGVEDSDVTGISMAQGLEVCEPGRTTAVAQLTCIIIKDSRRSKPVANRSRFSSQHGGDVDDGIRVVQKPLSGRVIEQAAPSHSHEEPDHELLRSRPIDFSPWFCCRYSLGVLRRRGEKDDRRLVTTTRGVAPAAVPASSSADRLKATSLALTAVRQSVDKLSAEISKLQPEDAALPRRRR